MNSVEAKLAVNEMPLRFAGQPNHRMTLGMCTSPTRSRILAIPST